MGRPGGQPGANSLLEVVSLGPVAWVVTTVQVHQEDLQETNLDMPQMQAPRDSRSAATATTACMACGYDTCMQSERRYLYPVFCGKIDGLCCVEATVET